MIGLSKMNERLPDTTAFMMFLRCWCIAKTKP